MHSDQGSQFTSKEFTEFCESVGITQSMSKAGYPYDNVPMEHYSNTLKNELKVPAFRIQRGLYPKKQTVKKETSYCRMKL